MSIPTILVFPLIKQRFAFAKKKNVFQINKLGFLTPPITMAKFMPYDLLKTNFIQQDAKLNSVAHSGFVSNLPFSPYCPIHFKCLKNILKMEENQPHHCF